MSFDTEYFLRIFVVKKLRKMQSLPVPDSVTKPMDDRGESDNEKGCKVRIEFLNRHRVAFALDNDDLVELEASDGIPGGRHPTLPAELPGVQRLRDGSGVTESTDEHRAHAARIDAGLEVPSRA